MSALAFQNNEDSTAPSEQPVQFRETDSCPLIGTSQAIQQVNRLIGFVADDDASVLVLGESGTGKELVARRLHYLSSRRDKPFVPVNCGAIPHDLLESELFGHEKGAFTGAQSSRTGRFELARGGTLFLDEIGEMSLAMQVKILRVLQERVFERVGSSRSMTADVRIIAATHRNLEQQILAGNFREDLYYRINVFPIEMPPLRERTEDLPLLINQFCLQLQKEKGVTIRFTRMAMAVLQQYAWPGNIRELGNLVKRLVILYPGRTIEVNDLPAKYRLQAPGPTAGESGLTVDESAGLQLDMLNDSNEAAANPIRIPAEHAADPVQREISTLGEQGMDLKSYLEQIEQSLIRQALDESGGVVSRAADMLNLRRTTLVEKLRKYGVNPEVTRRKIDNLLSTLQ
jgi:sigma-54 specific flagellar transcriptional regulator A